MTAGTATTVSVWTVPVITAEVVVPVIAGSAGIGMTNDSGPAVPVLHSGKPGSGTSAREGVSDVE